MGFFDKLLGKSAAAEDTGVSSQPLTVLAPFSGSAMKLEDIPDPVFSQGILGPGCGMDPAEETVYAPFDGSVIQTTDTKHAVGVVSADGIEVLIHVGMDTVEMGGQGFTCMVKEGDKIKAGQPLMKASCRHRHRGHQRRRLRRGGAGGRGQGGAGSAPAEAEEVTGTYILKARKSKTKKPPGAVWPPEAFFEEEGKFFIENRGV